MAGNVDRRLSTLTIGEDKHGQDRKITLPPATATAYALRHPTITDLIALHKLDTLTVAQLSGTSPLMIEQPQVSFTAFHYTPQSRTNTGDWGS